MKEKILIVAGLTFASWASSLAIGQPYLSGFQDRSCPNCSTLRRLMFISCGAGTVSDMDGDAQMVIDCDSPYLQGALGVSATSGGAAASGSIDDHYVSYDYMHIAAEIAGHRSGENEASSFAGGPLGNFGSFEDTITFANYTPSTPIAVKIAIRSRGQLGLGFAKASMAFALSGSGYSIPLSSNPGSEEYPFGGYYSITRLIWPSSVGILGGLELGTSGETSPTMVSYTSVDEAEARFSLEVLTPGVTFSSCSGASYAPCDADLNGDGLVDDADYLVFSAAYNNLLCPLDENEDPIPGCAGDLDNDGDVDDDDFILFSLAYDDLLCP